METKDILSLIQFIQDFTPLLSIYIYVNENRTSTDF